MNLFKTLLVLAGEFAVDEFRAWRKARAVARVHAQAPTAATRVRCVRCRADVPADPSSLTAHRCGKVQP